MTDSLQVEDKFARKAMLYSVIVCLASTLFRILFISICTILSGEGGEFILFDNYNIVYYALDYSNGFITRGLAGALFGKAVMNMGVSVVLWVPIIKIIYSFCFYAMAFAAMKKYFRTDNTLCIMIAMMFMRPLYLNSSVMYVIKTDIFWYTCMIPILIVLWSDKRSKFALKMTVVLIFSIISMLFHQAFIFIFAPLVCAILLDKNEMKWLVVYGLIMCTVFVFLSKFCTGDYTEVRDMIMSNLEASGMWERIKPLASTLVTDDGTPCGIYYEYGDARISQLSGDDYNSQHLLELYTEFHIPIAMCLVGICGLSFGISLMTIGEYCKTILKHKLKSAFLASIFILPFISLILFTIDADRWLLMTLTSLNVFAIYVALKYGIRVPVKPKTCTLMFAAQLICIPFFVIRS